MIRQSSWKSIAWTRFGNGSKPRRSHPQSDANSERSVGHCFKMAARNTMLPFAATACGSVTPDDWRKGGTPTPAALLAFEVSAHTQPPSFGRKRNNLRLPIPQHVNWQHEQTASFNGRQVSQKLDPVPFANRRRRRHHGKTPCPRATPLLHPYPQAGR